MEKMKGGLADGLDERDFDPIQLQKGIKVEAEHTDDLNIAKEIAMDHLAEDPEYYMNFDEQDVGFFLANKDWYSHRGIPYKRERVSTSSVEKMIRDVVDGDDPEEVVDDEVASGDSQYNL